jgi:hypothetical protein
MIKELISEGKELVSEVQVSEHNNKEFFESVNFEKWVVKSILYFDHYQHNKSLITDKVKSQYSSLNPDTTYSYYQFLLGALQAVKEFDEYGTYDEDKVEDEDFSEMPF